MKKLYPIERLFFPHVKKTDDCWIWDSPRRDKDGYGWFRPGGRRISTHRFSWLYHRGPIPEGMSVLHRCDRPYCVNPDHLWLGTQKDNVQDMMQKGRHRNQITGRLPERQHIKRIKKSGS